MITTQGDEVDTQMELQVINILRNISISADLNDDEWHDLELVLNETTSEFEDRMGGQPGVPMAYRVRRDFSDLGTAVAYLATQLTQRTVAKIVNGLYGWDTLPATKSDLQYGYTGVFNAQELYALRLAVRTHIERLRNTDGKSQWVVNDETQMLRMAEHVERQLNSMYFGDGS